MLRVKNQVGPDLLVVRVKPNLKLRGVESLIEKLKSLENLIR